MPKHKPRFTRTLVVYLLLSPALFYLLPGFAVSSPQAALCGGALAGVIRVLAWPVLRVLTLPLTVVTLGLSAVFIDALLYSLTAWMLGGLWITSFSAPVLAAVLTALCLRAVRPRARKMKTVKKL